MQIVSTTTPPGPSDAPFDPVMIQGGEATRRTPFPPEASGTFKIGFTTFFPGCRNIWHTHSSDMILVVTHGSGIMATRTEQYAVNAGDVVLIPGGEEHFHAAGADTPMTHLIVQAKDSQLTVLDE